MRMRQQAEDLTPVFYSLTEYVQELIPAELIPDPELSKHVTIPCTPCCEQELSDVQVFRLGRPVHWACMGCPSDIHLIYDYVTII